MVTREDVERARATIGDRVHRTPTFTSATLSKRTGAEVFLKAELFQRTGSFKIRGVLNKLASLGHDERARGVIGISAGNHAAALAHGAALEGVDALLVMWRGANETKVAATREYGAQVDLEAADPTDAFARLDELIAETGRTLVHPFDDPLVCAGQGTLALEIEEDAKPETVVVPVGGGGLISGILAALPDTRIVAVEPELASSMHKSLERGERVDVRPTSVADGLNAPHTGAIALELARSRGLTPVLVSEDEIEEGFRFLYGRAKLACEPAGAAATGALLAGKVPLDIGERVTVVVSGGNTAPEIASAILAKR